MKGKLIWVGMLLDIQGQLSCLLFLSSHRVLSGHFGQRGDFFFPFAKCPAPCSCVLGQEGGLCWGSWAAASWDVITVVLEPLCPWEQAGGKAQS